jgi:hypothetical protein
MAFFALVSLDSTDKETDKGTDELMKIGKMKLIFSGKRHDFMPRSGPSGGASEKMANRIES